MSDYTRDFPLEGPDMVETTSGNPLGPYKQHTREEVVSGLASLGNPFGGTDIFKDGPGDALTAQLSLIDLKEAIHPLACEDCGHVEPMSVGDVEHCLLEAQKAIQGVAPHQQGQWIQKLYQLLWESLDEFHNDWVGGLLECPRKGWAGSVLAEMKAGRVVEAWKTLHKALRGESDDAADR